MAGPLRTRPVSIFLFGLQKSKCKFAISPPRQKKVALFTAASQRVSLLLWFLRCVWNRMKHNNRNFLGARGARADRYTAATTEKTLQARDARTQTEKKLAARIGARAQRRTCSGERAPPTVEVAASAFPNTGSAEMVASASRRGWLCNAALQVAASWWSIAWQPCSCAIELLLRRRSFVLSSRAPPQWVNLYKLRPSYCEAALFSRSGSTAYVYNQRGLLSSWR